MSVSKTLEAKILRYHHVEKWRVGTIARELSVHHSVVERVLLTTGASQCVVQKTSIIDPYLPFILEQLKQHPKLTASRLYQMAQVRGYTGGPSYFRHLVSLYRPKPLPEAFLRLRTLPGEQGQVDWGHFGYLTIGQAKRPLMAFVMVLSYSRKIFLQFYLNQQMANFLRGHVGAFQAFGGAPRVCLYDNLKSAVLERQGDAIRFHPTLLALASHYRFEPRPVAVARGNEKGRVERAIRYIRSNFFAAREFSDINDLNQQAYQWCQGPANARPCPEDKSKSVGEVFAKETAHLLILPDTPYEADEHESVVVGKTPYIRFDKNDYSVPYQWVRKTVSVRATLAQVSIIAADDVIAQHPRCYDKNKQIEDPTHIKDLVDWKKQSRKHRGQDRLIQQLPIAETFLIKAAQRHYPLASMVRILLQLLDDYGVQALNHAMAFALSKDTPHINSVKINLQNYREQQNKPPPVSLDLPDDKRIREQVVRVHSLASYDEL